MDGGGGSSQGYEQWLWHGTSALDPEVVCGEGFDFRLSKQGLWGRATYFALKVQRRRRCLCSPSPQFGSALLGCF